MGFHHILDDCFATPGAPADRLLPTGALDAPLAALAPTLAALQAAAVDKSLPHLALPSRHDDLAALSAIALRWRAAFTTVVVLGTGGSSLGGQTLTALAETPLGPTTPDSGPTPRLVFLDNVDPSSFAAVLQGIDAHRTGFVAISKSGRTAETLCQLTIAVTEMAARVGADRLGQHVLVVTEPGDNPLRRLAAALGLPALDHDPKLGGRFCALSVVGVLPMLLAGLDPVRLRAGARQVVDELVAAEDPADCRAAVGAALAVAYGSAGRTTSVLMPYCDRLAKFAAWWRQLWAESLGKAGRGFTPAIAVGAVDQHSQLQLWLDGPRDKLFTLITVASAGDGPRVAASFGLDPDLAWLAGRTMGDLLHVEADATLRTIARARLPLRHLRLSRLGEVELGALMMHFMLETIFAAALLEVDPFDQPAVEDGKILARKLMADLG